MALYIKGKELNAIHLGDSNIIFVYLGSKLVWSAAMRLWKDKQIWKDNEIWKY